MNQESLDDLTPIDLDAEIDRFYRKYAAAWQAYDPPSDSEIDQEFDAVVFSTLCKFLKTRRQANG